MLRRVEQLGCLLLCGLGAWAQQEAPKILVNIDGFRYPPIAASARIEGDVVIEISASGQKLIASAHSVLEAAATRNLATWTVPPLENGKYIVTFHFELLPPGVKHEMVPIGNKLERFFRRFVGARTENAVDVCYVPDAPPPNFTVVKDSDVRIEVVVRASPSCLNAEVEQLARRSHL